LLQGLLLLQESIGKERRPLSWVSGEQTVIKPSKPSYRDLLTEERMQAMLLKNPDEL
jgi:NADH-quinone oxidoreductase subunit B